MISISDVIKNGKIKYVIFDLFDTVVFRSCKRPSYQFAEMFEQLPKTISERFSNAESFYHQRVNAELEARKYIKNHECNLYEIWSHLLKGRSETEIKAGLHAEELYELNHLFLDDLIANTAKQINELGIGILIATDTYFSKSFIEKLLLEKLHFPVDQNGVFPSNEYRLSKSNGLFDVVLNSIECDPHEVFVIGDNYESDFIGSSRSGLEALHLPNGTSEFWEIVAAEEKVADAWLLPQKVNDYAITSLRARAVRNLSNPSEFHPQENIGSAILGPIFAGYVHWLSDKLIELKIESVFALKREGTFLRELYELLPDRSALCSDLHVSRVSLIIPSIFDARESELIELFNYFPQLDEVKEILELLDIDTDRHLLTTASFEDKYELFRFIGESVEIREELLSNSRIQRAGFFKEVNKSLQKQGTELLPQKIALIDLGWGGTISALISRIFKKSGLRTEFHSFFLCANSKSLLLQNPFNVIEGYLINNDHELLFNNISIIEQIVSDHSRPTIAYGPNGAIQGNEHSNFHQIEQAKSIKDGASRFFREIDKQSSISPIPWGDRSIRFNLLSILKRFLLIPSQNELNFFSSWSHSDTRKDLVVSQIIPTVVEKFGKFMNDDQLHQNLRINQTWIASLETLTGRKYSDINQSRLGNPLTTNLQIYKGRNRNNVELITNTQLIANDYFKFFFNFELDYKQDDIIRLDLCDQPGVLADINVYYSLSDHHAYPPPELTRIERIQTENIYGFSRGVHICTNDPRIYLDLSIEDSCRLNLYIGFSFHEFDSKNLLLDRRKKKPIDRLHGVLSFGSRGVS